jgi:hypothetical protein
MQNLDNGVGYLVDVILIQTRHAYSSVTHEIDVVDVSQLRYLLLVQANETEHIDLRCEMLPVTRPWVALDLTPQKSPHALYPSCHCAQVLIPYVFELGLCQDCLDNLGSDSGRVRYLSSRWSRKLTKRAFGRCSCW